jgi:hypothetical protein
MVRQLTCVVFDLFRARVVAHDESSRTISNGVHEEARDGSARRRHVVVRPLIVHTSNRGTPRAWIRRRKRLGVGKVNFRIIVASSLN